MTDEQEAMVAGMTEGEMIEVMVAMRKKADQQDWIWEDIEEMADRGYWRGRTCPEKWWDRARCIGPHE